MVVGVATRYRGGVLHDALPYAYLFGAGLAAGTLNVLAGGGSAITLPLMIFLGLPPTVANGTNRVAILSQNAAAVWGFRRHGLFEWRWFRMAAPPAVIGSALGAWAALSVGDAQFQRILAATMVLIALWMLWRPLKAPAPGESAEPPTSAGGRTALVLAFFAVGLYGGFIQAGVGILMLAVSAGAGLDLVRGNALKVLLALAYTVVALAFFSVGGKVSWALGASLAAGEVLGALAGVRLTVLKGHDWIRRVVTVVVVLFAIRLWWTA